jgi:hypothetical protein
LGGFYAIALRWSKAIFARRLTSCQVETAATAAAALKIRAWVRATFGPG